MNREKIKAVLHDTVRKVEVQEVARRAVEDELIDWRDNRRSMIRNNGLVIREADGEVSSVIRFGPETAVVVGLDAIADLLIDAIEASS